MPRRIAVVVAAHDAESTIRSAVESVLSGSHPCRVIVVDDASRLPVANVLPTYGGRVEIIRLDHAAGPAAARTIAIEHALASGYDYVAILDADDLCYADRLATQAAFLEAHPMVGAVGSHARDIDADTGATIRFRTQPAACATVRTMMHLDTSIIQESAMFRASALREVGTKACPGNEADDLLGRVAARFEIANVPELLLACRVFSHQPSYGRCQPHLALH